MVEIELEKTGCYKVLTPHPEGVQYHIIRTEEWDHGPRGGKRFYWESCYEDRWGSTIESECLPMSTLREAREELAQFFASLEAAKASVQAR